VPTSRGKSQKGWSCITDAAVHRGRNQRCSRWRRSWIEFRPLSYARQNLRSELSVEELAAAAHLSVRQFTRAFRQETGQSPARAVEALRVEVARVMLEEGSHSVEEVADETGFGERERMRRSFVRAFGRPPQAVRRDLRAVRR
jgi:transcriptional regulator GlxA family with amidase domain